jgi:uncharacterized GH25 family protein
MYNNSMVKKISIAVMAIALATISWAHEFWLMPQQFYVKLFSKVVVSFNVGENYIGENWSGNNEKINLLQHHTPSAIKNIDSLLSNKKGDSIAVTIAEQGTHMILFNGKNSFISLAPEKFEAYLKEDGLFNSLTYRKQNKQTNKNGTEYYQRSVKTLIQCGKIYSNHITQTTQLPLDIVPATNPYSIGKAQQNLAFTIYFKQQPLANQMVKYWHKVNGKKLVQVNYTTNAKGQIFVPISPQGKYMISSVYMQLNKADTVAQWQSYWGSLTFGYQ